MRPVPTAIRTSVRIELTPSEKGGIAEVAIAAAAIKLGIRVSRPMTEGQRYDLIFDVRGRLWRVQCKWAARNGNVLCVPTGTSRLTPRGYVRTTYSSSEVDAIAAYSAALDECFFVPIEAVDGANTVTLRLTTAKNNQKLGVKMAADYQLGAIAQLGERLAGSQKAEGSSPSSSTTEKAALPGGLF
jgi:hypothetical protein